MYLSRERRTIHMQLTRVKSGPTETRQDTPNLRSVTIKKQSFVPKIQQNQAHKQSPFTNSHSQTPPLPSHPPQKNTSTTFSLKLQRVTTTSTLANHRDPFNFSLTLPLSTLMLFSFCPGVTFCVVPQPTPDKIILVYGLVLYD